ncbi:MAG TPA: nucleotide exchange factor GrpE [Pirellulaceae bacterium]|nr:nucleotide exchange factor GrpE [Pirellulaceae bacterium]
MSAMPDQTIDNAVADAALESVAAEVQTKPRSKGSAADQKVADLEQQIGEANERALRSHAELENYRKRSQRELVEERRYAVVPLVRDLLAVVDNLERAIEAAQKSPGGSGLLDGVKMVASQFENILKQHQCVRIETVGTPFDPNQHQAIAQEPSDEHPAGTITRAAQSGYKLHDRVIRPAQVFVSTGPSPA